MIVPSACVELLERDERTPSIVAADRLARALGTSLAEMFAERLAPYGFCCIIGGARRDIVGKSTRHSRVYCLQ